MPINTSGLPQEWNMAVYEGDTWPAWSFLLVNDTGGAITNGVALMQIKKSLSSSTVVKSISNFIKVGNLYTFNTNVDLPKGIYVYDLQITIQPKIYTIYDGSIEVKKQVTQ